MQFIRLESVDYSEMLELQNVTVDEIAAGEREEIVYLLEHPHVFTMGRRGSASNLLSHRRPENSLIDLHRVNRGGDITYHGPGQVVGYPHLDLRRRGRDLHRYLRDLEQCLIETAAHFNVIAFPRHGLTGVWTDQGKLASIGVGVRRWITMHGFALNVSTDLRYFDLINPCGIPECPVTSLAELTDGQVSTAQVLPVLESCLSRVFRLPSVP